MWLRIRDGATGSVSAGVPVWVRAASAWSHGRRRRCSRCCCGCGYCCLSQSQRRHGRAAAARRPGPRRAPSRCTAVGQPDVPRTASRWSTRCSGSRTSDDRLARRSAAGPHCRISTETTFKLNSGRLVYPVPPPYAYQSNLLRQPNIWRQTFTEKSSRSTLQNSYQTQQSNIPIKVNFGKRISGDSRNHPINWWGPYLVSKSIPLVYAACQISSGSLYSVANERQKLHISPHFQLQHLIATKYLA